MNKYILQLITITYEQSDHSGFGAIAYPYVCRTGHLHHRSRVSVRGGWMWSMLRLDIFQSFPAGGKHEMEQKPDLKRPVGSFRSIHPLKGGNIVFFGGEAARPPFAWVYSPGLQPVLRAHHGVLWGNWSAGSMREMAVELMSFSSWTCGQVQRLMIVVVYFSVHISRDIIGVGEVDNGGAMFVE